MKPPVLVCLLLACLLVVPCLAQTRPAPAHDAAATPKPPPVVVQATVNGAPITAPQVNQSIATHWATPILRAIIEDRLIRAEAKKQGVTLPADQVQSAFEAERAKFASQAAFERHLRAEGYTSQAYIETLMTEALLQALLERQSVLTEDEVSRYYLDHQSDFSKPSQVHVFLISTDTIEEAYLVRERLAAGDKFDTVARELSKHASKAKGGDLGWVSAAELPGKALADAAQSMEPGIVSSPLRSGSQFYVVMVKERRPAQIVTLAEARPQIEATMKGRRAISRADYLAALARKANIQVNWTPAKALMDEYARLRVIEIVANGKPLELAQPPIKLPNGIILVPAKPLLQALGAALTWLPNEQALLAQTSQGKVKLTVTTPKPVAGTTRPAPRDTKQPVEMRQGTLYIAPRMPLEALGAIVTWDAFRNRLIVDLPTQTMPSPTVPARPSGLERQ